MTIYSNNEVRITIDAVDAHEAKVNVNGDNLIWISRSQEEEFTEKLKSLLDEYRI